MRALERALEAAEARAVTAEADKAAAAAKAAEQEAVVILRQVAAPAAVGLVLLISQ